MTGSSAQVPAAAPKDARELDRLKWAKPATVTDPPMGLYELLTSLQLMATDEGRQKSAEGSNWDDETPASMQVIKSGALSITRRWTKLVARVGGGASGVLALVAGYVATVQDQLGDPVTVALIGGAALLASATAIALALFIKGDLEARGEATAARHAARGAIVAAFLDATARLDETGAAEAPVDLSEEVLLALAAFPGTVSVSTKDHPQERPVTGVRRLASGVRQVHVVDDWESLTEVTSFSTGVTPPPQAPSKRARRIRRP